MTTRDALASKMELQEETDNVSHNLKMFGATTNDRALGEFLSKANYEFQQIIKDGKPPLWNTWNCELDRRGRLM